MKILAIETSCDDTGIAILEAKKLKKSHSFKMLSNAIQSQDIHANYGGVFPMMAKREHGKNIVPIFEKALKDGKLFKAGKNQLTKIQKNKIQKILSRENDLYEVFVKSIEKIKKPKIDALAVTVGPGLEPALWVGISFARALAVSWDLPIIPVNHMEGHILSILIQKENKVPEIKFPAMALLVSGGHTELVLIKDFSKYKLIGQTRDDAAGEAFDKVARMLGLPYPGGPEISKLANIERKVSVKLLKFSGPRISCPTSKASGRPDHENFNNFTSNITLPRPMIHSKDFDFSFSGLKTAVLYLIRDTKIIDNNFKQKVAKEFEDAAVEVLATKSLKAIKKYNAKTLIVGGGVSANNHLQKTLAEEIKKEFKKDVSLYFPLRNLSTDNAVMIALAGYFNTLKKLKKYKTLKAQGNLRIK